MQKVYQWLNIEVFAVMLKQMKRMNKRFWDIEVTK